jgi:hypothetical protein
MYVGLVVIGARNIRVSVTVPIRKRSQRQGVWNDQGFEYLTLVYEGIRLSTVK